MYGLIGLLLIKLFNVQAFRLHKETEKHAVKRRRRNLQTTKVRKLQITSKATGLLITLP